MEKKRRAKENIDIHITLSRDAQRPPSLLVAHSGARHEISDLREICGAGRRNSAGSSGRCSSGGGPESAPFSRRARGVLAPRSSLETRGVPSSGVGPSQNGTCLGDGIGSKIRAGRTTRTACWVFFSARQDPSLCNAIILHRVKIVGSFR